MQRTIAERLGTFRAIGLALTDSLLLTPTKSVTAVIGVSKEDAHCVLQGCELCEKTDCAYRRGNET